MRSSNLRRCVFVLTVLTAFTCLILLVKRQDGKSKRWLKDAMVLWWTPILKNYYRTKQCGVYKCTFTTNRTVFEKHQAKALLFYGSDMNSTDLPLPRSNNDVWALFHEESPKNVPYIQFEPILRHFNITATPSRYSDLPLTTQYLESLDLLTTRKYLVPVGEKTNLRTKKKLAPVVFLQSICDTMSGRDSYVRELMQYIEIDSYGKCLNNKKMPESLTTDYLRTIDSEELYKFLSQYKFIIAYENGVCNDYITEKFWRPLIVGSVPIYFGSPTVKDWMPNNKSAILIKDFESPQILAEFLIKLDKNDIEYNTYLDHKYSIMDPITNKRLIKEILDREYSKHNLFEDFECFVCQKLHNQKSIGVANKKHFDCGERLQFPKMSFDVNSLDWHSVVQQGKCEAGVLDDFLVRNHNFTKSDFDKELIKQFEKGICFIDIK